MLIILKKNVISIPFTLFKLKKKFHTINHTIYFFGHNKKNKCDKMIVKMK